MLADLPLSLDVPTNRLGRNRVNEVPCWPLLNLLLCLSTFVRLSDSI